MGRILRRSVNAALLIAGATASHADAQQNLESLSTRRLVEDLRIGSTSDPNIGFSQIGSIAVDGLGQIFVLEVRDKNIRVYSPSGVLIRRISRAGDGPGEFRNPGKMGLRGDTIWTFDAACSSISNARDHEHFVDAI